MSVFLIPGDCLTSGSVSFIRVAGWPIKKFKEKSALEAFGVSAHGAPVSERFRGNLWFGCFLLSHPKDANNKLLVRKQEYRRINNKK